ncbi:MAG: hypothetical protein ACRC6E_01900 [Fusobacteriaceae bacterium]
MNKYRILYIKAILINKDIVEGKKIGTKNIDFEKEFFLILKNTLIAISNFSDFELELRFLYSENLNISKMYSSISKHIEFFKYLRNKYVGHLKKELIEKAIEWRPELLYSNTMEHSILINVYILETAINSYCNDEGENKIFESDTDLVYSPDLYRFYKCLQETIEKSSEYLESMIKILKSKIELKDSDKIDYIDFIKAGETKFEFIKKGKR